MGSRSQELQISTQHNQLCSLCTLGDKSQWTKVYYVTLVAAWCVYFLKNIQGVVFTKKDDNTDSPHGFNINIMISFVAWIMSVVAITNASADDVLCDPENGNAVEKYHENASFLLFFFISGVFFIDFGHV
jgi:hypothetical protein